jgi:hypothetical protein
MDVYLIFRSCIVAKFPVPIKLMFVAVYLTRRTLPNDEILGGGELCGGPRAEEFKRRQN